MMAVDARQIVHVLRTIQAGFPDPAVPWDDDALSYCTWNQLVAVVDDRVVITPAGEKQLGQLYPVTGSSISAVDRG